MSVDPELKQFATERQAEIIDAIISEGSQGKAAKKLNCNKGYVNKALKAVRHKAHLQGYSPEHDMIHTAPDSHLVKGTSTLYDEKGTKRLQWVKTNIKAESLQKVAEEIIESLKDEITGTSKSVKAPKHTNKTLLAVYPMGDPHIGMYAWAEETGNDFDCDTAEHDLRQAIDYLVEKAPDSDEALIANLGDFFHSDTMDNTTRRSGNTLDVDSRWSRVLRVGVHIMRYCIEKALAKHKRVTVINEIGNHDDQSSYTLSLILSAFYENSPRVTIDLSPKPFHYYRFHSVMIGITHGHNTKHESLGPIMATDMPKDWGETKHRYWYVGHIHHRKAQELPGVMTESFRTLAGKDAWHSAKGYRAGRDMMCIVHHKDHGEVSRHRFDISMVK
ncbi:MAG: hypothetical protein OQK12_16830 [Motiliproteus sp.]|nr:hypothetical protein [Motiliproteus sp.]MCW9051255.1 hypothetical protein [Motiliproteus sp.]